MPIAPPPTGEEQQQQSDFTEGKSPELQNFIRQAAFHVKNTNLSDDKKIELLRQTLNPDVGQSTYQSYLSQFGVDPTHAKLLTNLRFGTGPQATIAPMDRSGTTLDQSLVRRTAAVSDLSTPISDAVASYRKHAAENTAPEGWIGPEPQGAPPLAAIPPPAAPTSGVTGLLTPGNITNLYNRPALKNPDGSISTTRSASFNFEGKEVLLPTVVDGKRLTNQQAIDRYRQTGEHLGIFDTPEHADAYATALHESQANTIPGALNQDLQPKITKTAVPPSEPSTWDLVKNFMDAAPEPRKIVTDPATGKKEFAGGDATYQPFATPYGVYGTLANMAGGLLGGIVASHYNAETGQFTPPKWMMADPTVPWTYALVPPPAPIQLRKRSLSDILTNDIGVPEQVAKDGTAAQVGNFVGSIVPWTAISKTLGALTGIADSAAVQTIAESATLAKLPEVVKTVAAKNVLDIGKEVLAKAGIQAATGATFEQLQPASPDETTKDWAIRTGKTALYAGAISGIVDGLLAIPEASQMGKTAAAYKAAETLRDKLADVFYRARHSATPDAAKAAATDVMNDIANRMGGVPEGKWSERITKALDDAVTSGKIAFPEEKVGPAAGGGGIETPPPMQGPEPPMPEGAPKPGEPPAAGVVQGGKTVATVPLPGAPVEVPHDPSSRTPPPVTVAPETPQSKEPQQLADAVEEQRKRWATITGIEKNIETASASKDKVPAQQKKLQGLRDQLQTFKDAYKQGYEDLAASHGDKVSSEAKQQIEGTKEEPPAINRPSTIVPTVMAAGESATVPSKRTPPPSALEEPIRVRRGSPEGPYDNDAETVRDRLVDPTLYDKGLDIEMGGMKVRAIPLGDGRVSGEIGHDVPQQFIPSVIDALNRHTGFNNARIDPMNHSMIVWGKDIPWGNDETVGRQFGYKPEAIQQFSQKEIQPPPAMLPAPGEASPQNETPTAKFAVGDKVEIHNGKKWVSGTVKAYNPDTQQYQVNADRFYVYVLESDLRAPQTAGKPVQSPPPETGTAPPAPDFAPAAKRPDLTEGEANGQPTPTDAESGGEVHGTGAAADVQAPEELGAAGSGTEPTGGPGGVDTGTVPEKGARPGGNAGTGESGVNAGTRGRVDNSGFYRITAVTQLGSGGPVAKFRDNIKAIKILKSLMDENRLPTESERDSMARYVGWGGLSEDAFSAYNRETGALAKELEELLTPEEYQHARESVKNSHFTSELGVRFMWDLAQRLGFKGGTFLETSMGIGNFFGLAPEGILGRTNFIGVELDPVTGNIAKYLYPSAQIMIRGFETVMLPDDSIDFVGSNFPFGSYGLFDPRYKALKLLIHDYFFIKSLDKIRPGGIVMAITSKGTLDKPNTKIRELMADKADLIAAYRLPNDAFMKNARTQVTTDIVILQKREPGAPRAGEAFLNTKEVEPGIVINEYFAKHPENMFGKMTLGGTMYRGGEATLDPTEPLADLMAKALAVAPKNVMKAKSRASTGTTPSIVDQVAPDNVKELAYVLNEKGQLMQRVGGVLTKPQNPALGTGELLTRMKALIGLREQVKKVIAIQLSSSDDVALKPEQERLNDLYDAYIKKHGFLNGRESNIFAEDPQYPLLLALENYISETKNATKTDIFTKRTIKPITPLENVSPEPKEALLQVLAERGYPDLPFMAQLSEKTEAQVAEDLEKQGLVFREPQTGTYELADAYLSGYVRDKLAIAETAADQDARYQKNVDALKAVQPETIRIDDPDPANRITVKLGNAWVPVEAYKDFIKQRIMGNDWANVSVVHVPDGSWKVAFNAPRDVELKWGSPRVSVDELLDKGMNLRRPTVVDKDGDTTVVNREQTLLAREKLQVLKTEFSAWAANSNWSKRLENIYNNEFNGIRLLEPDGQHLTLPGISSAIKMAPHQLNTVWRIITDRRALVAHVVGSGKSFVLIAAAMELRRLGISKKNMLVVPNGKVEQFRQMFMQLYPAANILAIGKEDLGAGNRQKSVSRIATGNWDAVIVQHSSFGMIPISPELMMATMQKEMDELEETIRGAHRASGNIGGKSDKRDPTIKALEKVRASLEARLKELADAPKDNTIKFDELGVDYLFVDELHEFKNLTYYTKMGNMSGLSNSKAKKGLDLKSKTDYIQSKHGGRGVIGATGTPISNSMVEAYNMMRYVAPDVLEKAGIRYFDDWAANFGDVVDVNELSPDGRTYRIRQKFAEFTNVPELVSMIRSFMDVKHAHDLDLPTPKLRGGAPQPFRVKTNDVIEPIFQDLLRRAESLRADPAQSKEKGGDNWLTLTGDGKKIALDARLYDPELPDHPESKANMAVGEVFKRWKDGKTDKTTQVIFADLYRHTDDAGKVQFNLFKDMKAKLVKMGVPADEIVISNDIEKEDQLERMQRQMNAGEIRILFGTTAKIGVGINIQQRLGALHDLDAPWRPDQLEQRHGRIVRQGNLHEKWGRDVEILQYVTEQSFDAYIFQALETKMRFIAQVMSGKSTSRNFSDPFGEVVLSYAELKAIASGNPDVKLKMDLEVKVNRLGSLENAHERAESDKRYEVERKGNEVGSMHTRIAEQEQAKAEFVAYQEAHPPAPKGEPQPFDAVFGGKPFTSKDALTTHLDENRDDVFFTGNTANIYGAPIKFEAVLVNPKYTREWEVSIGGSRFVPGRRGDHQTVAFANTMAKLAGASEEDIKNESGKFASIGDVAARILYGTGVSDHKLFGKELKFRIPPYAYRYLMANEWHDVPDTGAGLLEGIRYDLGRTDAVVASYEKAITEQTRQIAAIRDDMGKPFAYAGELAEAREGLKAVNQRLMPAPEEKPVDQLLDVDEAQGDEDSPKDGKTPPAALNGEDTGEDESGRIGTGVPASPSVSAAPPVAPLTIISKQEILKDLSDRLNIPLRTGRFRGAGVLGIFKRRQEVVRTKKALDLDTSAHEFGHAINKILWGTTGTGGRAQLNLKPLERFRSELEAIATPTLSPNQDPIQEGFAEFIRLFLTSPGTARLLTPTFFNWFEQELKSAPELDSTLADAQANFQRWINQPPAAKVLSQISVDEHIARRANRWQSFYTAIVDRFEPIRKVTEDIGPLEIENDPYRLARLFSGWMGRATRAIEHDTFDPKTFTKVGNGLKDILEPVKDRLDDLRIWLVASRVIEKADQGIDTGISKADAQEAIATMPDYAILASVANDLYEFQDWTLQYMVDRGVMSKDAMNRMRHMNRNYVPFYRVMEATLGEGTDAGRAGTGHKFADLWAPTRRMKGSGREIVDPLESIIKNTYLFIQLAERNRIGVALVNAAKTSEKTGRLIEGPLPPPMRPVQFALNRIEGALSAAGVDVSNVDLDQLATFFTPSDRAGGKDNVLSLFMDGKRQFYQVDPELFRALEGMNEEMMPLFVRMLAIPARILRLGATQMSPEFILLRNPLRDAAEAFMLSQRGFIPGVDSVRGLFHALKRDDLYWEWMSSGGAHAAMASMERTNLQEQLKDLLSSPLGYALRHPIDALAILGEMTEAMTRLGVYQRSKKATGSPEEASFDSRNATVDFARRGAKTTAINMIVAFWNANVQGVDAAVRGMKQRPWSTMLKGLLGLTLPTLLLYLWNREDPLYDELPSYVKDFFFTVSMRGTPLEAKMPFLILPKPWLFGMVFSSVPERIMQWIDKKDRHAFDDLAANLFQATSPGIFPTALGPVTEAWANKSMLTGRAIVPQYMMALPPKDRYEYYTSEMAKLLADGLDKAGMQISPMQLDVAMMGYTGGLGRMILEAENRPLRYLRGEPPPPEGTMADIPGLRAITVRYPSGNLASIQRFYNRLTDLQQAAASEKNTQRAGGGNGPPMSDDDHQQLGRLTGAAKELSGLRKEMRTVIVDPTMTPELRRQNIDKLQLQIANVARTAIDDVEGHAPRPPLVLQPSRLPPPQ